ncbi:hypothetical protein [Methylocystis sp. ATCC 49242]|uniref:hypothetical protein n=1 Tax=Methylocystis sp. ATCC 49242 TaxID=622637 RepID=UPI0001F87112|nr:hypothetical protein [Methylocystis sp. ATCC 49242]
MVYYPQVLAYQSRILVNKFFATEVEAKQHDFRLLEDRFHSNVIAELMRGDTNSVTHRAFQLALDLALEQVQFKAPAPATAPDEPEAPLGRETFAGERL